MGEDRSSGLVSVPNLYIVKTFKYDESNSADIHNTALIEFMYKWRIGTS